MIEGYFSLFAIITGGIVGVVGAIFTVRSSLIKSNLDALKELLTTVTAQRDNAEEARDKAKTERDDALQEVARLQGENKTLREIATQTPEIINLTKAVTKLTEKVEKHFIGGSRK